MGDRELLEMLASETDRRTPAILEGVKRLTEPPEPDADGIEAIRVEAHGLKGAALVVGQSRLAELARQIEIALVQTSAAGVIEPDLAARITAAAEALQQGVRAAAGGEPEPASVDQALSALEERSAG